jgi:hypothetical protein
VIEIWVQNRLTGSVYGLMNTAVGKGGTFNGNSHLSSFRSFQISFTILFTAAWRDTATDSSMPNSNMEFFAYLVSVTVYNSDPQPWTKADYSVTVPVRHHLSSFRFRNILQLI